MIDFLVIGGGIAGLSAGAYLSSHGSVTVLEAETALGYHTSGRSAALFEKGYGPPSVMALNAASAAFFEEGDYLSSRGLMLLADKDQSDLFHRDVADMGLQQISISDAQRQIPILNPNTVCLAALSENAFDIDTDRVLQNFARTIRANSGQILCNQRVHTIGKTDHWTISASQTFEARQIVNAAGAWADEVAWLSGIEPIGITPCRRSIARIPAPGGHDLRKWPVMLGAGESWYAKPDAGKLLVSPADADPVPPHDAFADDFVLAEGIARYEAMVTEPVTRVETNWAGLRSFVQDGTLVLGPDPLDPSFIWAAGQGGYGFQTAPAAGQLLSDLVTGASPQLDAAATVSLSAERFRT